MKKRLLMLTFLGAMVVGIETMAACGLDGSGEEMSCSSDMSGEEMSEEELSREGAIEMLRSDLEGLRVSERELSEICEGLVWENYKDDPILTREPEGERAGLALEGRVDGPSEAALAGQTGDAHVQWGCLTARSGPSRADRTVWIPGLYQRPSFLLSYGLLCARVWAWAGEAVSEL